MTFKNIERRDSFETRESARANSQNTQLPEWLRNAWGMVAEGRARSVEEALEKRDVRKPAKPVTTNPMARTGLSPESRAEYAVSRLEYVTRMTKLSQLYKSEPPLTMAEKWEKLYSKREPGL